MVNLTSISTLAVFVYTGQETSWVRSWILRSMRWKEHLLTTRAISFLCIVAPAVCLLPPHLHHQLVIWDTPLIVLYSLLLLPTMLQAPVASCSPTSCNWWIASHCVGLILMLEWITPLICVAGCYCYAIPGSSNDSFLDILILRPDLIIYLCFVLVDAF